MSYTYDNTPPQLPGMAQEVHVPNGNNKSPREAELVGKDGKVDIMSKLLAYLNRERKQARGISNNANTVPPATPGLDMDTSNSTTYNNIKPRELEEDDNGNIDITSNLLKYLDREKKKAVLHAAAGYPTPNDTPRKHEPKNPLPKTPTPTRKSLAEYEGRGTGTFGSISDSPTQVPLRDRGLFSSMSLIAASPASTAASSPLSILNASPAMTYSHPGWVQEQDMEQMQDMEAQGDCDDQQKRWVEETKLLVQRLAEEEAGVEEQRQKVAEAARQLHEDEERVRHWLGRLEMAMRGEQAADMEAARQHDEEEEEEEEEQRWIREAEDHMLAKQAAEEMRAEQEHAAKQHEARGERRRRERNLKQEARRAASRAQQQQLEAKIRIRQQQENQKADLEVSLSSAKSSSSRTPAPSPALLLRISMSPVRTRTSFPVQVLSGSQVGDADHGDTPDRREEASPASTSTSTNGTSGSQRTNNKPNKKGKLLSKELKALHVAEHGHDGGQGRNVVGVILGKRKRDEEEHEHEHIDIGRPKTKTKKARITAKSGASVSTRNVWNGRLRSRSGSAEKEGLEDLEEHQHPVIPLAEKEKEKEKEKTKEPQRKMVTMKVMQATLARILGSGK